MLVLLRGTTFALGVPGHTSPRRIIMRFTTGRLQVLTVMIGAGILITWAQTESLVQGEPTGSVQLGMGLAAIGACLAVAGQVARRRDP